jgi:hypothetical protein
VKLLKIDSNDLTSLAVANAGSKDAILVPCCYAALEGVYVNYDDMVDDSNALSSQRDALANFDSKDVITCTFEDVDDFRNFLAIYATARAAEWFA